MKPLRSVFVCCLSAFLMAACSSAGDPNEPTDEKTDDGAEALANTGGGTLGIGAACTACGCYYHWRRVGDRHILTCSCPVDKQACFDCKYSGNCKSTAVFATSP
jgi:hypothetical protein